MIVKMCGIKTLAAAMAAEEAGADFIGFVFWPRSKRYAEPQAVREIARSLGKARKVGVFVDAPLAEVNEIAEMCNLDFVQLHGTENADYAKAVNRPIIKAYRYGDGFSAAAADAFPAELILLDSYQQGSPGGNGRAFAWQEAAEETKKLKKPLLVAGGLNSGNVAEALDIFHPYGVDVSGGLEDNGEKSPQLMQSFMAEVERARLAGVERQAKLF